MSFIVPAKEVVKGSTNISEITGEYVFLKITQAMRGLDWEELFEALNLVAQQGWEYRDSIVVGTNIGFVLQKKK